MSVLDSFNNFHNATIMDIKLTNGYILSICDYSEDLIVNETTYRACMFERSSTRKTLKLESQDLTINFLNGQFEIVPLVQLSDAFKLGMFDNAEITVRRVFFKFVGNFQIINLFKGFIDDASFSDNQLQLIARDFLFLFNQEFPKETYTMLCNNKFKDSRCNISLNDTVGRLKYNSKNMAILVNDTTVLSESPLIGGWIEFTTMINFKLRKKKMMIFNAFYSYGNHLLQFAENFPVEFDEEPIIIRRGCDKTKNTCMKLNNLQNFRGFPKIPRPEVML